MYKIIGIIGAMEEEVDTLKESMQIDKITDLAGLKFYVGKLEERDVVVVKCGIGKVNAALCAQVLISEFKVNCIINTGVAGAIESSLDVQDMVISTDTMEHDFDTTAFGDPLGTIPRMDTSVFVADERLIAAAQKAGEEELSNIKILKGRIVSGDIFVSSKELKDKLESHFGAYAAEMEGAAIGHVCHLNKTPYLVIRAMSDKADGSAHTNFAEFSLEAAKNSKKMMMHMLKHI